MLDLLRRRRSIRKYSNRKIDPQTQHLLQEALLRAPSSRDLQPCEFIFVDNPDMLGKLSHCKIHGSGFLAGAPLGIVVCGDEGKSDVWVEDCSIASILVQMAALSLGLGSCWIQVRNRQAPDERSSELFVRNLLGIPARLRIDSIVAIGYPAEDRKPVPEEDLDFTRIKLNTYS